MSEPERSQSELVGIVLLTAVIVTLASVVGVFLLGSFQSESEDDPNVLIQSEINETYLTVAHNGGDSFSAPDVEVILRNSDEIRVRLPDGQFVAGSDTSVFEPGDVWRYNYTGQALSSGEVRLLVFDQDAGTLLYQDILDIPATSP